MSTMTSYTHTYGPSCSLHTGSGHQSLRPSEPSTDPPKIRAQFFYSSALPIDDPLSRVPPPPSNSTTTPARIPPRPFSVFDNTALEDTWQTIQKASYREKYQQGPEPALRPHSGEGFDKPESDVGNLSKPIGNNDEQKKTIKGRRNSRRDEPRGKLAPNTRLPETEPSTMAASVRAPVEGQHTGDLTLSDDPDNIPFDHAMPVSSDETGNDEFESVKSRKRRRSPFHRRAAAERFKPKEGNTPSKASAQQPTNRPGALYGSSPIERDTTGTPFLRVASRLGRSRSGSSRSAGRDLGIIQNDGGESTSEDEREQLSRPRAPFMRSWADQSDREHLSSHDPLQLTNARNHSMFRPELKPNKIYTTVGISRLHVVEMPDLRVSKQGITTGPKQTN